MSRNSITFRCADNARCDWVNTFMPSATGVAHEGCGFGIGRPPISTSTMHMRQLAAIASFS